jgi:anti-sigma factor RsiW
MDCKTTQWLSPDKRRGRLAPSQLELRQAHLQGCAACRQAEQADEALDEVLEGRLTRYAAPTHLKRRLQKQWVREPEGTARRLPRWLAPAAALAVALALVVGFSLGKQRAAGSWLVTAEAVSSHLRLLEGESPLAVAANDMHQVKPWFAGKLDYAPPMAFVGDSDYPLVGGSVVRLFDQRVARFLFARRLHKISLFVCPAKALSSGLARAPDFGDHPAAVGTWHGFSLVGWMKGEFAYLLVSDLNAPELIELGRRMATPH